jgi:hypothetical protein
MNPNPNDVQFMEKPRHTGSAVGRFIWALLFWIWGMGGFVINSVLYLALQGNVGMGTSAYMALGFLYWIGGMLLFGLGALIARSLSNP